nr:unnamed protein product [Callosobruchus chinensis]
MHFRRGQFNSSVTRP